MAMSRSLGATELTSRSPIQISPEVTVSSPATMASRVDLPQPEGPTSAMNSPCRASRSMPLSTSTMPKFLVRLRTVRDDMEASLTGSSFDRALGQPAHEILAAEEVDEQRGEGADEHGGARHVVGVHAEPSRAQRHERRGNRLLGAGGEDDAEQELVPDAGELPDHRNDQDRRRDRDDHLPEDAPEAGAVDAGRLDQVVGDVDVEIAAEERGERYALHAVNEDQAIDRIGEVELAEEEGPRHQRQLAGYENAEQHAGEQELRAAELPFAEHVAVHRPKNGGNDRRRNGHG